eukprot:1146305-Pelagomonas_calceolata.AAC.4
MSISKNELKMSRSEVYVKKQVEQHKHWGPSARSRDLLGCSDPNNPVNSKTIADREAKETPCLPGLAVCVCVCAILRIPANPAPLPELDMNQTMMMCPLYCTCASFDVSAAQNIYVPYIVRQTEEPISGSTQARHQRHRLWQH